jgi:hypothetical protein
MSTDIMSSHYIPYGKKRIYFELEHRSRKSLAITVYPDLSVKVVAPPSATLERVKSKVKKRASWIQKQKLYFEDFLPASPPKKYISGETFRYLGRQYRLKVFKSKREEVKLKGKYITVYTANKNNTTKVRKLLNAWYRDHARRRFEDRIKALLPKLKKHKPKQPTLQLKKMAKRWGSCSVNGKILLNPELIKTPSQCIDYVIMHELCHLVIPNHSPSYYKLLKKMVPDWEEVRSKLNILFN